MDSIVFVALPATLSHVPCQHTETNICASCLTQNLSILFSCVRLACFNSSPKLGKIEKKEKMMKSTKNEKTHRDRPRGGGEKAQKKNLKLYVLFTNEILLYQMATRLSLRCNKVSVCRWAWVQSTTLVSFSEIHTWTTCLATTKETKKKNENFQTETARTCSCNYTPFYNEMEKKMKFSFTTKWKKEIQKRNVTLIFYQQRHYFLYCLLNRHHTKHTTKHTRRKKWAQQTIERTGMSEREIGSRCDVGPFSWWAVH